MTEEKPYILPESKVEKPDDKGLILFGRDVTQIPCFRNSFLYGTLGGLGFGLAHFMFTSKIVKSTNYSVYAFSMITIGYWIRCRYQYSKKKFEMMQLQHALEQHIIYEGVEEGPGVKETIEVLDI
ncbi:cytochrome c oxidase assembly protein COX20, mitochondrial [Euwallacea fornicatus]|uniref:cytochrome c oxidase assembly protein COX20, mitochondrial n=1 Tax=Euwallacea fornicatus TaxID=995702 RepID=UPI00338FC391